MYCIDRDVQCIKWHLLTKKNKCILVYVCMCRCIHTCTDVHIRMYSIDRDVRCIKWHLLASATDLNYYVCIYNDTYTICTYTKVWILSNEMYVVSNDICWLLQLTYTSIYIYAMIHTPYVYTCIHVFYHVYMYSIAEDAQCIKWHLQVNATDLY